MINEYINPETHTPAMHELFVQRDAIAQRMGEVATILCTANAEYVELIAKMIETNDAIRSQQWQEAA